MSRKDMEREISRNTTLTSRLQHPKDIPTPEGIQVFTPGNEGLPILTNQLERIEGTPSLEGLQVLTPGAVAP